MKKRLVPLLMSGLIIAFSCNDELPDDPAIVIDDVAIENFVRFVDFSVDEAFRAESYDTREIAERIVKQLPAFEARHHIDLNYQSGRGSSHAREVVRSSSNDELAQKIVYYSSISANEDQYLSRLRVLKREVQASEISPREKSALLTQITLNEEFVRYLQHKEATFKSLGDDDDDDEEEECKGWWSCWGKCVAGIVGGAGTGALTFGFAGAAAGTITVPVVGTISLGVVGAVAGGVAGGLGGAAASCD